MDEALDELATLIAKVYFRYKRQLSTQDLALASPRVQSVHGRMNEATGESGELNG